MACIDQRCTGFTPAPAIKVESTGSFSLFSLLLEECRGLKYLTLWIDGCVFALLADVLAASTAAAGPVASVPRRQATPQSASPVAAWCTVTDRLRRLRADLEVTHHVFLFKDICSSPNLNSHLSNEPLLCTLLFVSVMSDHMWITAGHPLCGPFDLSSCGNRSAGCSVWVLHQ